MQSLYRERHGGKNGTNGTSGANASTDGTSGSNRVNITKGTGGNEVGGSASSTGNEGSGDSLQISSTATSITSIKPRHATDAEYKQLLMDFHRYNLQKSGLQNGTATAEESVDAGANEQTKAQAARMETVVGEPTFGWIHQRGSAYGPRGWARQVCLSGSEMQCDEVSFESLGDAQDACSLYTDCSGVTHTTWYTSAATRHSADGPLKWQLRDGDKSNHATEESYEKVDLAAEAAEAAAAKADAAVSEMMRSWRRRMGDLVWMTDQSRGGMTSATAERMLALLTQIDATETLRKQAVGSKDYPRAKLLHQAGLELASQQYPPLVRWLQRQQPGFFAQRYGGGEGAEGSRRRVDEAKETKEKQSGNAGEGGEDDEDGKEEEADFEEKLDEVPKCTVALHAILKQDAGDGDGVADGSTTDANRGTDGDKATKKATEQGPNGPASGPASHPHGIKEICLLHEGGRWSSLNGRGAVESLVDGRAAGVPTMVANRSSKLALLLRVQGGPFCAAAVYSKPRFNGQMQWMGIGEHELQVEAILDVKAGARFDFGKWASVLAMGPGALRHHASAKKEGELCLHAVSTAAEVQAQQASQTSGEPAAPATAAAAAARAEAVASAAQGGGRRLELRQGCEDPEALFAIQANLNGTQRLVHVSTGLCVQLRPSLAQQILELLDSGSLPVEDTGYVLSGTFADAIGNGITSEQVEHAVIAHPEYFATDKKTGENSTNSHGTPAPQPLELRLGPACDHPSDALAFRLLANTGSSDLRLDSVRRTNDDDGTRAFQILGGLFRRRTGAQFLGFRRTEGANAKQGDKASGKPDWSKGHNSSRVLFVNGLTTFPEFELTDVAHVESVMHWIHASDMYQSRLRYHRHRKLQRQQQDLVPPTVSTQSAQVSSSTPAGVAGASISVIVSVADVSSEYLANESDHPKRGAANDALTNDNITGWMARGIAKNGFPEQITLDVTSTHPPSTGSEVVVSVLKLRLWGDGVRSTGANGWQKLTNGGSNPYRCVLEHNSTGVDRAGNQHRAAQVGWRGVTDFVVPSARTTLVEVKIPPQKRVASRFWRVVVVNSWAEKAATNPRGDDSAGGGVAAGGAAAEVGVGIASIEFVTTQMQEQEMRERDSLLRQAEQKQQQLQRQVTQERKIATLAAAEAAADAATATTNNRADDAAVAQRARAAAAAASRGAAVTEPLPPGTSVEARWMGGRQWYAGTIRHFSRAPHSRALTDQQQGPGLAVEYTYAIDYDDGDKEDAVPRHLIHTLAPPATTTTPLPPTDNKATMNKAAAASYTAPQLPTLPMLKPIAEGPLRTEPRCEVALGYYQAAAEASFLDYHGTKLSVVSKVWLSVPGALAGQRGEDDESVVFQRNAAEKGEPGAQSWLGQQYYWGRGGLEQDLAEARQWFQRAADHGVPEGHYNLGVMDTHGQGGMPRDAGRALEHFERAAELGYAPAQNGLGAQYVSGY
jgi:TPR repeat protein